MPSNMSKQNLNIQDSNRQTRGKRKCKYTACSLSSAPLLKCVDCDRHYHEACAVAVMCAFINNQNDPPVIVCANCAKTRTEMSFESERANNRRPSEVESGALSPIGRYAGFEDASDLREHIRLAVEAAIETSLSTAVEAAVQSTVSSAIAKAIDDHIGKLRNYIATEIATLSTVIENQARRIDTIEHEVKEIKSASVELSSNISEMNKNLNAIDQTYLSVDEICNEMRDIEKRANNILLFGFKELPKANMNRDTNAERIKVKNFFTSLISKGNMDPFDFTNTNVSRIGLFNENKVRPICISLESRDHVFKFLKLANLLPSGLRLSTDKTLKQRLVLKNLRICAEKHNQEHPQDRIHIKYIKNVPSLIDAHGKVRDPKNL